MTAPIEPTETAFAPGQRIFRFENGYGASVITSGYGHEQGLQELAVLKYDDKGESDITYDTPITSDVIGWLDEDAVQLQLQLIRQLPAARS